MTQKTMLFLLLAGFVSTGFSVTLEETGDALTVKNENYTIRFQEKQGYSGQITYFGKKKALFTQVLPVICLDSELDLYDGRYNPATLRLERKKSKATKKILTNAPEKIRIAFEYPFNGGKAVETLTFDDSPAIRYDVEIAHQVRLFRHSLEVTHRERSGSGIFYPDGQRISGVNQGNGKNVAGKNYCYAVYPDSSVVGIVPVENGNLAGIEYAMVGKKEGYSAENVYMRIVFNKLSLLGKQGTFRSSCYLLASADEKAVREAALKLCPVSKTTEIFSMETLKLITRPGQPNALDLDIRNHGAGTVDAELDVKFIYGIDTEKSCGKRKISLKAGERKNISIPLEFPADAKKGIAVVCELKTADGKLLDRAAEFCSVSDFMSRDAGFGIQNAGQFHNLEEAPVRNGIFKKKYIGSYEYYCWAESVIGSLAPKYDSWYVNSENPYSGKLTKKFVKGMIDDAHSRGIGVFSWITGLWNYKFALKHPDRIQYAKNGEPNIYAGQVYPDGRRRAVLKANMFTPERAAEWGNEMADSVDMFGWDGCRWDYTFVPSIKCDPLYAGDKAEDWYDWHGVPQSKLYPDPDKTGQKSLTAWRKAVESRHPNFRYGTNFPSGKDKWEKHPLYHQTMARGGTCLFEDMLNYSSKKMNTFDKWGDELAYRCDRVREYGGTCVVGYMKGLDVGGVSYHLANYTAICAGVKWWSNARYEIEYLRDAERNRFALRYAEYFYGCDFLRSSGAVRTAKKENVLFEPFVRERKTANGREIVVPIVNMPEENRYICQFHKEPPVRKDLSFAVSLKNGEKIGEVWLMRPQDPEKGVKLASRNGSFTVPELIDAALVLVRVEGK